MRFRFLILALLLAAPAASDVYERQPAVDVIHYDIALELADASDVIRATTQIEVQLKADIPEMWLDFDGMTIDRLVVSGKAVPYTHRDGRLAFSLDAGARRKRNADITVDYHGAPSKGGLLIGLNSHKHRVAFVENWPDNAHRWFPCIDHPHDKATVDLSVTAPAHYTVVSNGRLSGTRSLSGGRKQTSWSEAVPIPTYCMVFGAADFIVEPVGKPAGVPLVLYYFPEDALAARVKFARSHLALEYFAGLLGAFPYEKLAQVEAATLIGGMENAAAIFYTETSFKPDTVSESPVPHEIAHQWFGDSVTEADWDHLWLSEGFATYLDVLFYEHVDGHGTLVQRMKRAAEAIGKLDKKQAGPVIDASQTDPSKKLNAYNYEKGAWILHMLRGIVGERAFFDGLRRYYQTYRGKTALSGDFERVMESASGQELTEFFRQWLAQPGYPHYRVTWNWSPESRQAEVAIRQVQTTGLFDMPLEVVLHWNGDRASRKVRVSKETAIFRFPSPDRPTAVEIDPGGWVLKSVAIQNP